MIELIRLNDTTFLLNPMMIEQVQSYPDTTITLVNGKKIIVKNSESEVKMLCMDFYQKLGLIQSIHKVGEVNE